MKTHGINSKMEENRRTSKCSRSPSKKLIENASVFQEIRRPRNNHTHDTATTTPKASNAMAVVAGKRTNQFMFVQVIEFKGNKSFKK